MVLLLLACADTVAGLGPIQTALWWEGSADSAMLVLSTGPGACPEPDDPRDIYTWRDSFAATGDGVGIHFEPTSGWEGRYGYGYDCAGGGCAGFVSVTTFTDGELVMPGCDGCSADVRVTAYGDDVRGRFDVSEPRTRGHFRATHCGRRTAEDSGTPSE